MSLDPVVNKLTINFDRTLSSTDLNATTNSYGYRSDEFSKNFAKQGYLFSGCSFTYGAGLPPKKSWPYFLNKMLERKAVFNLGQSGQSIIAIIDNVYKYMREFGEPKGIFLLLPDINRFESYKIKVEDNEVYLEHTPFLLHSVDHHRFIESQEELEELRDKAITVDLILSRSMLAIKTLEEYLAMKGIPLVWTTWNQHFRNFLSQTTVFDNYFDMEEMPERYLLDNDPDKDEVKHWFEAEDHPPHPGIGEQKYFAEQMFKAFGEKFADKVPQ